MKNSTLSDIPSVDGRRDTVRWIREEIERAAHLADTVRMIQLHCYMSGDLPVWWIGENRARTLTSAAPHEASPPWSWTGRETKQGFKVGLSVL